MKYFLIIIILFFSSCSKNYPQIFIEDFPFYVFYDCSDNCTDDFSRILKSSIEDFNFKLEFEAFVFTETKEEAQIIVEFVDSFANKKINGRTKYYDDIIKIEILKYTKKDCVIQHELGHVAGHYSHDESKNTLMYKNSFCFSDDYFDNFKNWFYDFYFENY